MLSKSQLKLVSSLREKKYRREHGLFIVEGEKVVSELLTSSFEVHSLYATDEWPAPVGREVIRVTPDELRKISNLETPNRVLAVVRIRTTSFDMSAAKKGLILALDGIRDPGNLGTIIRTAEWFGVVQVLCSPDTVDVWNPKVVQATMGSIFRVDVAYVDLPETLATLKKEMPIYGAVLGGEDVFKQKLTSRGVLVIGSESHGISDEVRAVLTQQLLIPSFSPHVESLNASIATAILLSEFRRVG